MATDKRLKNAGWHVCDDDGHMCKDGALLAVLMDIRDELVVLRGRLSPLERLNCSEFLAIPRTLNRIAKNTHKPKRRRKAGVSEGGR